MKDQLRQKDKAIDSLINQFSKQNYLFQKRNTDNQLETNLESVKCKEENVKLKKTTIKRQTLEKGKVKKTQKQTSVTIKAVKKIFHMKLNLLKHQTAKYRKQ